MSASRSAINNAKGGAVRSAPAAGVLRPLSILLAVVLIAALSTVTACVSAGDRAGGKASELGEAQAAYDAGDYPVAESTLKTILEGDPKNLDALRLLALTLAAEGKNEESVTVYRSIVKRDPKDHECLYRLAVLERVIGDPRGAVAHLDAALKVMPSDPAYSDEMARTLMTIGDYDRAAAVWGRVLTSDGLPKDRRKELLVLQGQAYQAAKNYSKARWAYSAALKIDPDDASLRDRVETFQ